MRHLGSIVMSLVLAAGVYVLVGIGAGRLSGALITDEVRHDYASQAIGAVALLAAGALFLLLVLPRISPLGPLLAGLVYVGLQAWEILAPAKFGETFRPTLLGVHGALSIPVVFGIPLLLAVPLLGTVLSPQRWRGRPLP